MRLLSVGELAERSGLPVTTLRYYDSIGLLVPDRLANGHRRYPAEAVEQLELVRLCRELGLSLEEVATVLGPGGGAARRALAQSKLHDLDATLHRLRAVRAVLLHFAQCHHTAEEAEACRDDVRRAWHGVSTAADHRGRAQPPDRAVRTPRRPRTRTMISRTRTDPAGTLPAPDHGPDEPAT